MIGGAAKSISQRQKNIVETIYGYKVRFVMSLAFPLHTIFFAGSLTYAKALFFVSLFGFYLCAKRLFLILLIFV